MTTLYSEIGLAARDEYRATKKSKSVKRILENAGYDYTIRYTRKEARRFTRIVNNKLFNRTKPVRLTNAQARAKIAADKIVRENKFFVQPHSMWGYGQLPIKKRVQRPVSIEEYTKTEKPISRIFDWTIDKHISTNSQREYSWKIGNFRASTRKEAKMHAKRLMHQYENDTEITGITVYDKNGDNSITFYQRKWLLSNAA